MPSSSMTSFVPAWSRPGMRCAMRAIVIQRRPRPASRSRSTCSSYIANGILVMATSVSSWATSSYPRLTRTSWPSSASRCLMSFWAGCGRSRGCKRTPSSSVAWCPLFRPRPSRTTRRCCWCLPALASWGSSRPSQAGPTRLRPRTCPQPWRQRLWQGMPKSQLGSLRDSRLCEKPTALYPPQPRFVLAMPRPPFLRAGNLASRPREAPSKRLYPLRGQRAKTPPGQSQLSPQTAVARLRGPSPSTGLGSILRTQSSAA